MIVTQSTGLGDMTAKQSKPSSSECAGLLTDRCGSLACETRQEPKYQKSRVILRPTRLWLSGPASVCLGSAAWTKPLSLGDIVCTSHFLAFSSSLKTHRWIYESCDGTCGSDIYGLPLVPQPLSDAH